MKSGKSKVVTALIVLGTIGLASAPVIFAQFRNEVARWYLAAATNNLVAERDTSHQIEQAQHWAEDVTQLRDYWIFRAEQALATSPAEVAPVIKSAVTVKKSNFFLAELYAHRLANVRNFTDAVDVLDAGRIPELDGSPSRLNNLAYYRALASVDLDQALVEINLALKVDPHYYFRDTRAWVLFQMGKPQLALEDANFAIAGATASANDGSWLERSLMWFEDKVSSSAPPQPTGKVLTRREAGESLWGVGTMFYHRAKIFEALGRSEEAAQDFQWLSDHDLPTDDSIF